MTTHNFEFQMNRLRGAFGAKHFDNDQRTEMIWETVKMLEDSEFAVLVTTMIGGMRKAPLPIDFIEATKGKRRYIAESSAPGGLDCEACHDLGVLRCMNTEEKVDTLVLCVCAIGKRQPWKLPALNVKIKAAFTVVRPPLAWFKPDKFTAAEAFLRSDAVGAWKERVRDAEKYWKDWGSIFEDKPTHHMQGR